MAVGDIKLKYAASSALTQTSLDTLASSSDWRGCWESDVIDNSANGYADYLITGVIKVAASGLAAGQIRIGIVAEQDDTTWPDVFDGTESSETITTVEIRDKIVKLGEVISTTTTAGALYHFGPFSVAALFGGVCPRKFVVVIAQSTGQTLEGSGDPNKVFIKGVYFNVAAS